MKKERETTAQEPQIEYCVHFGVYIPEMRAKYSKADLEQNLEVCAYLAEIGSQAISLKPLKNK